MISDTARQLNISQGEALSQLVEAGWESTKRQPLKKHSEPPISSEVHERLEAIEVAITVLLELVMKIDKQGTKEG